MGGAGARAARSGARRAPARRRSLDHAPFLEDLHRIAQRHLGPIIDRRHAFGERAALEALLREAGLRHVQFENVSRRISFSDGSAFLQMNTRALVGMSGAATSLAATRRRHIEGVIVSESQAAAARHTVSGMLSFDIAANVALATR